MHDNPGINDDPMAGEREAYLSRGFVAFAQPPAGITFSVANKPVFSITGDGKLEAGEGLSNDEASRALFDVIANNVPCFISTLRERAEKAEAALGAATHETLDEVDSRIREAVDKVCRRAGGIHDDPQPLWVREIFKAANLAIVPLKPTSE